MRALIQILCVLFCATLVTSASAWSAVLPHQNFLVVASKDDSLTSLHQRFAEGVLALPVYARLVGVLNPSVVSAEETLDTVFPSGTILTLPGQQTLASAATLLAEDGGALTMSNRTNTAPGDIGHKETNRLPGASSRQALSEAPIAASDVASQTAPRTVAPEQSDMFRIHKVAFGETLFSLSRRYQATLSDLLAINGYEEPFAIYEGQELRIPTQKPSADGADYGLHRVAFGETLYGLAAKYNVTTADLLRWNSLRSPNAIFEGQTLRVAALSDNLDNEGYAQNIEIRVRSGDISTQHSSQIRGSFYTVQPGDSLLGIARRYDLDVLALAKSNALEPPFKIRIGQELALSDSKHSKAVKNASATTEDGWYKRRVTPNKPASQSGGYSLAVASVTAQGSRFDEVYAAPAESHSSHLHELLFSSARVLFCMNEPESAQLLAELRGNFQDALAGATQNKAFESITNYLHDRGYLRAELRDDPTDRTSYMITGARYQVGNLDIAPKQRSRRGYDSHPKLTLPVNQFYSPQVEQQLTAVAAEWLSEQGYPLIDVSALQRRFDDAQQQVDLRLVYDASRTVHVTAVDHHGPGALSQQQLKTLSPFEPGTAYSQSALERFRERLMATGYYRAVSFELLSESDRGGDGHRLEVNTTPAKRDRIQAGVGYAQGRGPVMNAALTLPNITGNEDDVQLSARTDDFVQQANLAYRRRNLLWYGADLGLSARAARQDQPYFVSDLVGIDLLGAWHGRDRQDGSSWHVSLGWSSADERRLGAVENQRFEYGRLAVGRSGRGSGLFDFARDWSVNLGHAFSLNPDTDDYWTLSATTDWVLPALFDRHFDLRLGADIRYAENLQAIPLSAQLFHGGEASNRGYESASFSSLEFDAESTAYLAYAQLEMPWDVNIQSPWLTQLIPFLDLSVMGADGDDPAKGFSSIGLGFAGEVAGYPYRADLAVPFDNQAGKGLLVNFNVGLQ